MSKFTVIAKDGKSLGSFTTREPAMDFAKKLGATVVGPFATFAQDSKPKPQPKKESALVKAIAAAATYGYDQGRRSTFRIGDAVVIGQDGMRRAGRDAFEETVPEKQFAGRRNLRETGGEEVELPPDGEQDDDQQDEADAEQSLQQTLSSHPEMSDLVDHLREKGMSASECCQALHIAMGRPGDSHDGTQEMTTGDDPPPFKGMPIKGRGPLEDEELPSGERGRIGARLDEATSDRRRGMDAAMRIQRDNSYSTQPYNIQPRSRAAIARDAKLGIKNGAADAGARNFSSENMASTFGRFPMLQKIGRV